TTSPDPSWKPADSNPDYTLDHEEPLNPVNPSIATTSTAWRQDSSRSASQDGRRPMKPSWSIFDCRHLISFRLPLTPPAVFVRPQPAPAMDATRARFPPQR
ncbi:hypothetical protein, partial [Mycobacterium canetti]|uniref:hypothetical protein n=1 Tax=Mycobacterium canetti TaxID=78331 RepID=UPI00399D5F88